MTVSSMAAGTSSSFPPPPPPPATAELRPRPSQPQPAPLPALPQPPAPSPCRRGSPGVSPRRRAASPARRRRPNRPRGCTRRRSTEEPCESSACCDWNGQIWRVRYHPGRDMHREHQLHVGLELLQRAARPRLDRTLDLLQRDLQAPGRLVSRMLLLEWLFGAPPGPRARTG